MRRSLAAAVAIVLVATLPIPSAGAVMKRHGRQPAATGSVEGIARSAQGQPLARHTVQIRDVQSGQLAGSSITSETGQFSFAGLAPGSYVVEIVNPQGQNIGASAPFAVASNAVATVAVTATAVGALSSAPGAGFKLFGFGTAASAAIVAGATIGIVAGVIATQNDASSSR